nr:patatin-like phospholipase family protein [Spirosomataceae bacterium]
SVLAELEEESPGKTKQFFAISGVSGGSVGAAFYTAFYKDYLQQKNPLQEKQDIMHTFHLNVFKSDFLSPLLTACLGGDLLQKFLPFVAINSLDRAQYLEDTWAHYYQKQTPKGWKLDKNMLNEPFLDLWKDANTRYQVPVLFLNTTRVETGQRAVLTPLSFQDNSYFHEVIDLQEHIRRNISLKVAASMSARFPIVTPPATVVKFNKPTEDVANYVDGGYVDNTGLETAGAILNTLTKHTERWPVKPRYRLIFIRNSSSLDPANQPKPVKTLYEYSAPLSAFINAWDNSTGPKLTLAKEFLREKAQAGKGVDSTLFVISLDRNVGTIPLGWELSKDAEARIDTQIETLAQNYKHLFKKQP